MLKRDLSYELFSREPEDWAEWAEYMAKREPSPSWMDRNGKVHRVDSSLGTGASPTKREPSPSWMDGNGKVHRVDPGRGKGASPTKREPSPASLDKSGKVRRVDTAKSRGGDGAAPGSG